MVLSTALQLLKMQRLNRIKIPLILSCAYLGDPLSVSPYDALGVTSGKGWICLQGVEAVIIECNFHRLSVLGYLDSGMMSITILPYFGKWSMANA